MHLRPLIGIIYVVSLLIAIGHVAQVPAEALEIEDGILAVNSSHASDLSSEVSKECWLLSSTEDITVVLMPADFSPTRDSYHRLEQIRDEGAYFIYLVADADLAEFSGDTEVLWREGHTVLLWTSEHSPQLTSEAIANLPGIRQPVRLSIAPKIWPAVTPPPEHSRTDFHPLASQMVSEITESAYMDVWQVLDDFETRFYNTAQNEASSQWMLETLQSYGLTAEYHYYQQSGTRRNVVGTITGTVNPNHVVYLVGHFDSISGDPQNHAPGADDNGSGTAAVLEAARVMSQYSFENTIKFVAFNGEEQGLYGSSAFVDDIPGNVTVLGCYNYDMIAYAGTDPLPPDLIIYTNTASLAFAQVLADACTEFVPSGVEPVIVNESMGSSDHGPFWDAGHKAICGIEARAWSADFNPWYHTEDDRIERYPIDYPTNCTKAFVAAAAQIAVPMQPETPYLTISDLTIDDDSSGASSGNGNGIIEYGETIELMVTLDNMGLNDATGVTADLDIEDEYLTMITGSATYGVISGGGSASSDAPFVFTINSSVPDGHEFACDLSVSEEPGALAFTLSAAAPEIEVISYSIDDSVGGDGDGIAEAGETVQISVTLNNSGSIGVDNLVGVLTGGAYLTIDNMPLQLGSIASGASAQADPRNVTISSSAPALYSSVVTLDLDNGAFFDRQQIFTFNIGDIFTADFEDGAPGWIHSSGTGGYSDEWHLEVYRNHTYGGGTSWKCGGNAGGDYGDELHAILESTPFILPAESVLTFWHWMSAETSGSYQGYCYDGGLIEISIDGGAWEALTPEDGYPYLQRDGLSPFPGETPLFSGSHDWKQETIDLTGYEGTGRIRFVFGSDGNTTEEGWYVDDVILLLTGVSETDDHQPQRALSFRATGASPSRASAALQLDLPASEEARVEIFDASGRSVRLLIDRQMRAGRHNLIWDGRSDNGVSSGSGVYWARATLGQQVISARLMIFQ